MFRYNKISNVVGVGVGHDDSDSDLSDDSCDDLVIKNNGPNDSSISMYDIQPKNETVDVNTTILDTIIQHPYIENLSLDLNNLSQCREKIHLIIYRINKYGQHTTVEFYLTNDFLSLHMTDGLILSTHLNDTLRHIPGSKRIKGNIILGNNIYAFVQVRENTDHLNWLSMWDIIVNKQYFGEKINVNVIDFFTVNCEISTLILNKNKCMSPIVLYSYTEVCHLTYINKSRSIQYCQRENSPLIRLNTYKVNDNVRTICFIEDMEFSDTLNDLADNNYIIIKDSNHHTDDSKNHQDSNNSNDIYWIFKNEKHIFLYVK
jgi:hypothetical protein